MQQHIYYIKYALQFADMQIPELVNTFNSQVGSRQLTLHLSYAAIPTFGSLFFARVEKISIKVDFVTKKFGRINFYAYFCSR